MVDEVRRCVYASYNTINTIRIDFVSPLQEGERDFA